MRTKKKLDRHCTPRQEKTWRKKRNGLLSVDNAGSICLRLRRLAEKNGLLFLRSLSRRAKWKTAIRMRLIYACRWRGRLLFCAVKASVRGDRIAWFDGRRRAPLSACRTKRNRFVRRRPTDGRQTENGFTGFVSSTRRVSVWTGTARSLAGSDAVAERATERLTDTHTHTHKCT